MGILILDDNFLPVAEGLIKQAKSVIFISTFKLEINDRPRGRKLKAFFDTLINRAKAGIKVKILFNWHDDKHSVPKTNAHAATVLKNAGIEVRHLKKNRCCHSKLLIVDSNQAIIGSHNLSIRSCSNNFEVSYLLTDIDSLNRVCAVFNDVFQNGQQF